jgi:lysine/ornithine N-monooxygenase
MSDPTQSAKPSQQHPPFPYPIPDSTTPFWRTELHSLDSHRSTPELPQKCDIVIIGAGYTGAAIAYHLLDGNESAGSSMVILEAREACSGATGRNGKTFSVILYAEHYAESSSLSKYPNFF